MYQGMERYLGEWWHLAVIPMIISYVLAAVLWIVGYASLARDAHDWTVSLSKLEDASSEGPYHLLLLSSSFYAFAVLLTFFEASHLLQVDSTLGPLHLSLMKMTKDIVRFCPEFLRVCSCHEETVLSVRADFGTSCQEQERHYHIPPF